jgi:hypothetical protein
MMTKKLIPLLMLMSCFLLSAFGCVMNAEQNQLYDTTTTTVAINEDKRFSAMVNIGTFSDAVRVTMEVKGEDKYGVYRDPLVPEKDLVQGTGGVWEGTLTGLPVGPILTFTARGYNADNVEIFSGVTTQVLTGVNDTMIVAMRPVDDVVPVVFPRVWSISLPAKIVSNTDSAVSVRVEGNADETMSYDFSAADGTYTPASGEIDLPSSGTGTINVLYTAPSEEGINAQSFRAVNSQGNSVEVGFLIETVYELTDTATGVLFAPVVESLSGKRNGDTVTWTAVVDDDKPLSEISYLWVFTGTDSAQFEDSEANPVDLAGYDDEVTGFIRLSVTDGDGLTATVNFDLISGQYPDEVVIYD